MEELKKLKIRPKGQIRIGACKKESRENEDKESLFRVRDTIKREKMGA